MLSNQRLAEIRMGMSSTMPDPEKDVLLAEVGKLRHEIRRMETEIAGLKGQMRDARDVLDGWVTLDSLPFLARKAQQFLRTR